MIWVVAIMQAVTLGALLWLAAAVRELGADHDQIMAQLGRLEREQRD